MGKNNKKFWEFKNANNGNGELMLYGDIANSTWWGDEVTPKQFKNDLDALGKISHLDVYINSNGGDIFAGQAIYAMLKRIDATITVHIDGLAASIASVIVMAASREGDKIVMPKGSMMMIHNGMIGLMGYLNASELRKCADEIEKITKNVVLPAYERSNQTAEKIQSMLDAETWLSAQEAVDLGFADEIEENRKVAASISNDVLTINGIDTDLSRFKNVPKSFLNLAASKPIVTEQKPPENTDVLKAKLALQIIL
ncbi:MAG: hypothetical protein A2Y15_08685 [Clostridiales bacterium GWF2_36_10]|nr:MAG: hypothetical protein A2Y15_08685 [Clostridiales bacterium GWF2_36_10]HAN20419.1 peptidase [Clostridiales bacterium]